jgi:hypothetical protein
MSPRTLGPTRWPNDRFWHLSDVAAQANDVCSSGHRGHRAPARRRPKLTQPGSRGREVLLMTQRTDTMKFLIRSQPF